MGLLLDDCIVVSLRKFFLFCGFFLFSFFKNSYQSVSEVPSSGILNKLGIIKQGKMSKLVLVPCFLVITVLAIPCRSHAIPLVRQMDEDGQNLAPLDQCTGEGCKCPPGSTGIQPFCREKSSTGEDSNRGPLFIPHAPPPPPPTPAINDTDAIGRLTNEFDDLKDDLTARISSLFSIIARLKIGKSKFCNGRSCQMCGMCQVYQQYGKSESPSFCKRSGEFTRKCGKCTRRCSRSSYQGRSGSIY